MAQNGFVRFLVSLLVARKRFARTKSKTPTTIAARLPSCAHTHAQIGVGVLRTVIQSAAAILILFCPIHTQFLFNSYPILTHSYPILIPFLLNSYPNLAQYLSHSYKIIPPMIIQFLLIFSPNWVISKMGKNFIRIG